MSGGFAAKRLQKTGEKLPVLRVWTSDVPVEHANMQQIAARAPEIQSLLGKHGVREADISPPLRHDHYPDDTHFHISAKARRLPDAAREEILNFMRDMGFEGNIGTSIRLYGPDSMRGNGFTQMDTSQVVPREDFQAQNGR